ncbi:hypothetical protein [Streptomyces sp. NPDC016172]|uniref:hypothetical protein n=1 Tax=Streptomyces sp. NPDC016172 TaxID=3364964 RepID=UPI0036FD25D5
MTAAGARPVRTPLIDGVEGVDVYLSRHLPQLLVTLAVPRAMVEPRAFLGLAPALLLASMEPRAWSRLLAACGKDHCDTY